MRDPRMQGQAFIDLVVILRDALGRLEQIQTIAIQLGLASEVSWGGNAEAQWTSLLSVVADRTDKLEELLE